MSFLVDKLNLIPRVIKHILSNLLSDYIEIKKDDWEIGLWNGTLSLKNVKIKSNAFNKLGLNSSFTIERGIIGSFELKCNWAKLTSEPVQIIIKDIYVLLQCRNRSDISNDELIEYLWQIKQNILEKLEKNNITLNSSIDKSYYDSYAQPFIEQYKTSIQNNIQLCFERIHIAINSNNLSDHTSLSSSYQYSQLNSFVLGLCISKLDICSTDEHGNKMFVNKNKEECVYRKIFIQDLCSYINSYAVPSYELRLFIAFMKSPFEVGNKVTFDYLIRPMNINILTKYQPSTVTINSSLNIDIKIDTLDLRLSRIKYQIIMDIIDLIQQSTLHSLFPHAPIIPPKKSPHLEPKLWWIYAIQVITYINKRKKAYISWKDIEFYSKKRKRYIDLYQRKYMDINSLSPKQMHEIIVIEKDLKINIATIMVWRTLAINSITNNQIVIEQKQDVALINQDQVNTIPLSSNKPSINWLSNILNKSKEHDINNKQDDDDIDDILQQLSAEDRSIFFGFDPLNESDIFESSINHLDHILDDTLIQGNFILNSINLELSIDNQAISSMNVNALQFTLSLSPNQDITSKISLQYISIIDLMSNKDSKLFYIMKPTNVNDDIEEVEPILTVIFEYKKLNTSSSSSNDNKLIYKSQAKIILIWKSLDLVYSSSFIHHLNQFLALPYGKQYSLIIQLELQAKTILRDLQKGIPWQEYLHNQLELDVAIEFETPSFYIYESDALYCMKLSLGSINIMSLDPHGNDFQLIIRDIQTQLLQMNELYQIQHVTTIIDPFTIHISMTYNTLSSDIDLPQLQIHIFLPNIKIYLSRLICQHIYHILSSLSALSTTTTKMVDDQQLNYSIENSIQYDYFNISSTDTTELFEESILSSSMLSKSITDSFLYELGGHTLPNKQYLKQHSHLLKKNDHYINTLVKNWQLVKFDLFFSSLSIVLTDDDEKQQAEFIAKSIKLSLIKRAFDLKMIFSIGSIDLYHLNTTIMLISSSSSLASSTTADHFLQISCNYIQSDSPDYKEEEDENKPFDVIEIKIKVQNILLNWSWNIIHQILFILSIHKTAENKEKEEAEQEQEEEQEEQQQEQQDDYQEIVSDSLKDKLYGTQFISYLLDTITNLNMNTTATKKKNKVYLLIFF